MFDRFTDRARTVMALARKEAQTFGHDYIGTEHILLGLIQEKRVGVPLNVLKNVLKNQSFDPRRICDELQKQVKPGAAFDAMRQLPFTAAAKKALEAAMEEAADLHHNYIGTEHILLGLIRDREALAARVLVNLGLDLEAIRRETLVLLGVEPRRSALDTIGELPFTAEANMALEAAMEEAAVLHHNYIGTEHILLGLIRDREALAARVLVNLGLDLEIVRKEVLALLGDRPGGEPPAQA